MNFIDLHCHTTASDGRMSPTELVRFAASLALRVIAVTDHDSTEGVVEALTEAKRYGLEVIPGVELSCDVAEGELHMLGYFVDPVDPAFQAELTRLREGRVGRAQRMVQRLTELGYPISFQRVQELAGDGAMGRPHVAQALLEAGHIANRAEAFDRFIGRNGPAYVPRPRLSPTDAVHLVRSVGGLPVFAHPFIVRQDGSTTELIPIAASLPELTAAGLAGLEAYYPRYRPTHTDRLLALARQYGLLVTGGSDFHGVESAGAALGSIYVPKKCVTALKEAHAASVRPAGG